MTTPRPGAQSDVHTIGTATGMRNDALSLGLTAAQCEAVHDDSPALCVIAGAGSGKTRVLTRRVARRLLDGTADPSATVVVTFTRKAAGELRKRLHGLADDIEYDDPLAVGTFHSLAYAQLRNWWELRGLPACAVAPSRHRIVADVLADCRVRSDAATVRGVVAAIDRAKAELRTPDECADGRTGPDVRHASPLGDEQFAQVYSRYEEYKLRRRLIDFDDMLTLVTDALRRDPAFARVVRRQTRHVFVDEFQDVSAAQYALLTEWCPPVDISGIDGDADLFVVGDDQQAIFGFAGARSAYLTDFAANWPGARVIVLDDNFRCPPAVLRVAAEVLAPTGDQRHFRAHVPLETVPTLDAHDDGDAELQRLVQRVRSGHRPGGAGARRWSGNAVLVRTNAQAATVHEFLESRRIPCVVRTVASYTQLDVIRTVLGRVDRERRPPGLPFVDWVTDVCTAVAAEHSVMRSTAARRDADRSVEPGDDRSGPRDSDGSSELDDVLAQLVELAEDYVDSVARPDAGGFVQFVRASTAGDAFGADDDAVTVMTMHRAKGLEFDTVHVPMLEEGFMPLHASVDDPVALDEERRLLYVTMTRARRNLHLSWAGTRRSRDGRSHQRRRSRFLDPVDAALAAIATEQTPADDAQAHATAARAEIRPDMTGLESADTVTRRDALSAWRSERALRRGIPPEAVLPTPLLERIAAAAPSDWAGLAAVTGVDRVLLQRDGKAILAAVCGGHDGDARTGR